MGRVPRGGRGVAGVLLRDGAHCAGVGRPHRPAGRNRAHMRRGEIWLADFGEPVGREQGYPRPALIVSNDDFNEAGFGLVVTVPLTTRDRGWAYHVEIPAGTTGLRKT